MPLMKAKLPSDEGVIIPAVQLMHVAEPGLRVVFPLGQARQACPDALVVPVGQAEQDDERGERACVPAGLPWRGERPRGR